MKLKINLYEIGLLLFWCTISLILFYLLQYLEVKLYGYHQFSVFDFIGCVFVADHIAGTLYLWAFPEETEEEDE